jgi:hypothetical protein
MYVMMNRTIKAENIKDWEDLDILHIYETLEIKNCKDNYKEGYKICIYEKEGKLYQFNFFKNNPPFQEVPESYIEEIEI